MQGIIARWEWRSFGPRFRVAEAGLAGRLAADAQESDELYLLSGAGDNVKIRDGLLDVKTLKQVDAAGLEQWFPIMKAPFPLAAADVAKAYAALRVDRPSPVRSHSTLDEFIGEVATPGSPIRAVRVHKHRRRFTLGYCMGELSDIEADGRTTRTIAVEGEDPAAVAAAVRALGLGGYLNTSYPRGLSALIDDEPARFAVIDVGTNSVKFHIGERGAGGTWRSVADRAEMTHLGEGLAAHGVVSEEAIERTAAAIAGMASEAKESGAQAIAAVGTAGLRKARNSEEVLAALRERAGVEVEVISGEEESRLAYLAAVAGFRLGAGSSVVLDTGGGSSQFTFGQGGRVEERFSVEVGAVRYTEHFGLAGAVGSDVLRRALAVIAADLSRLDGRPRPDAVVAMGGAVTNIAAVRHGLAAYDPDRIQGTVLERAEIDRQIELYRTRAAEARRGIVGLQPKRAEVILAGACIVRVVLEKLSQDRVTVSDRGLRHGLLMERFGD